MTERLMIAKRASLITLWLLTGVGLYSALSLSYTTITGAAPCPNIGRVPVCFIVAVGYGAMLISLIWPGLYSAGNDRHKLFIAGWLIIFLIAMIATLLEIFKGDTCPISDAGLPLCYLSLANSVLIFVFYRLFKQR